MLTFIQADKGFNLTIESPPEHAVPLGAAVIAGSFYTGGFVGTIFEKLMRERLSVFPFTIQLNTATIRKLVVNGKESDMYYHVAHESQVMIPKNVSMTWRCSCVG